MIKEKDVKEYAETLTSPYDEYKKIRILQNMQVLTTSRDIRTLRDHGLDMDTLCDLGVVGEEYYPPSDSHEYTDVYGNFYNRSGQRLRDPREYDHNSEGYTPFGDE